MHNVVDELESSLGTPPSVWPAYVAAVANVVLCVLLLISVLAMVTEQFVGMANGSSKQSPSQLVSGSASDGVAWMEDQATPSMSPRATASWTGADEIPGLVQQLQAISQQNKSLQQELELKKASAIAKATTPESTVSRAPAVTHIVFRVETGVYSLDEESEKVLMKLVQQYSTEESQWQLEAGVADLDEIATREVYAFANQIYKKLIGFGVSKSDIKFVLDKQKKQYDSIDSGARLRDGGMIISLRVRRAE